jgi:exonuclease VII large subunit
MIVACEPSVVEEMGLELTEPVARAVGHAVDLVLETVADLRSDTAPA